MAKRLRDLDRHARRPDWLWVQERATHSNARLSQALIVSGGSLHNQEMLDDGLASLDWLARAEIGVNGYFAPIGSNSYNGCGEPKAMFGRQPVVACGMIVV